MAARLTTLAWVRARTLRNSLRVLRRQSRLKIFVILFFVVALWGGLYFGFQDGFHSLGTPPLEDFRDTIVQILFAVFFLSLFIMLIFSNAIIAYGSLFRSEETAFLFARPFLPWQIFAYKVSETLLFSSWAFLFLALPLIIAYGVSGGAPWYFYPGAAAFFAVFAMIPAASGGIVTLLIARFLPRSMRKVLVLLVLIVAVPVALGWAAGFLRFRETVGRYAAERWVRDVLGRLSLSTSPLLPSFWIGDGIIQLKRGDPGAALFRFLLLLSTALFSATVGLHLSRRFYRPAYYRAQFQARKRRGQWAGGFYRLMERTLPGMDPDLRLLVVKDVKIFVRDPVQWSQVLIFFGLLSIYFANMRNLHYDLNLPYWQNFISVLNLVATCLTLSTFTSRFIFPLLSLEGRKFWILGLLPIERKNLLYSKFWFAFIGAFVISEALTGLSDLILREPAPVAVLHAIAVLVISVGLSALAVGIGALYPNLREDNPSKIVSGFGGTLNLVLSVAFVALVIALMVLPYHLSRMRPEAEFLQRVMLPGMLLAVAVGVVAVIAPLWLGVRAFERLEA
ncbi:MAG: putative ABC transporter permease subunit [Candidatus Brocadiia bacterium]